MNRALLHRTPGIRHIESEIEKSEQMCGIEHLPRGCQRIILACPGFQGGISSQEEDDMQRGYQYLFGSLFLTVVLAAPTAINAAAKAKGNGRQEENHRDDKDHRKIYDRDHKDYHNWNDNEDRSFRVYLGERHREYRPFAELKVKDQRAYWNWRHSHPDHDHNGH